MSDRIVNHEDAIVSLWLNWIISIGALVLPIILHAYIPVMYIPIITFICALGLLIYDRVSLNGRWAVCPLIPSIAMRSLFISGVIMLIIRVIYSKGLIGYMYDTMLINDNIPYLTVLVISPVTLAMALWSKLVGLRYGACRNCLISLGSKSERGFLGELFSQESKYQRDLLIVLFTIIFITSWGYYTFYYINVNINQPDQFFFGWIPVILYIISIIYLGARYFTVWAYYSQDIEGSDLRKGASTSVRFLIISGDNIYLARGEEYNQIPDSNKYDTPASLTVNYRDNVTLKEAKKFFDDISRLSPGDFDFRFMYVSYEAAGNRNIFHFICSPKDKEILGQSAFSHGKWYNLSRLDRMLHNRDLTPILAAEIHRLYTITMAWKTYDYDGRRLYKVKNYRPIFRLKDICDWDVDFNSSHWIKVSHFNEDKPFFRLRRLFRRNNTDKDEE
ncbi:MAG: hypothetical protein NC039_09195 [Muribaculaceae bacterium]|nr:hypothetical protein [Muribaculaceae bacterium]